MTMRLPFSRDAFFDVFGAYNDAWWPIALLFWTATLVAFVSRLRGGRGSEWTFGLLALQWAWSAVAYHATLFSAINPVAWVFAAMFLIQAGLFIWYGVTQRRLSFSDEGPAADLVGHALVAYGLLYPLMALAGGHSFPRVPTFGVPCPTTIVTAGFLVLVRDRVPPLISVVPVMWAAIGGSGAFLLGVPADLALPVAGLALALRTWAIRPAAIV
jgi:hypothetical protein